MLLQLLKSEHASPNDMEQNNCQIAHDDDVLLENQRDEGRHVLAGFTLAGDHLVMDASSS